MKTTSGNERARKAGRLKGKKKLRYLEELMAENIGVIGAGSWGTTLADLLAKKGHAVTLWAYEPELVDEMAATGINSIYLPGISLAPRLKFTTSLQEAVTGKGLLLFVVPSQVVRGVVRGV